MPAPETHARPSCGRRRTRTALLMLGHQPGIGSLRPPACSPIRPSDAAFDKFPTGATAVSTSTADAWAAVGWGTGRLVDFVVPSLLE